MSGVSTAVLREVKEGTAAAAWNEAVTRARVEKLERHAIRVESVLARGLWGRLRWLLTGR